ncbi:MFS transporter [Sporosarcina sp. Marseille-Q4063]|uniref:MFS transporter n=1 Tax=Sporosarcina sp. Marseille-Q4063 TaxID=2810514 RepID=UPI001BAE6BDC|nr:MFS transporter [Sporosarcina sp. Marseille-Q4063]QUW23311.1 MFS transporter [Sporosarcina sp. Marseille-Q4063]
MKLLQNYKDFPAALWILLINTLMMALGFYMIIPLLAVYLLENLFLSATLVGLIIGVRSFFQQAFQLWGGMISDRVGYKLLICIGVFIRSIGFIMFGLVDSIPGLLLAAILSGLGGAFFHPSSYGLYTVLSTPKNRSIIYSTRDMLSNVGFIVGPVVGAFLLKIDFQIVCLVSGIMFILVLIVSIIGLPSSKPKPDSTHPTVLEDLQEIVTNQRFMTFTILMIFVWFLFSQLYIAVPIKMDWLGIDNNIGYIYSSGAFVIVFLQVPLISFLTNRFSSLFLIALGCFLLTLGLFFIGITPNVIGIYLGVITFAFGQMFLQPMISKEISEVASISLTASYFGFNGLALAIGGLAGNLLGGVLYDLGAAVNNMIPWAVFVLVGIITVIVILAKEQRGRVVN